MKAIFRLSLLFSVVLAACGPATSGSPGSAANPADANGPHNLIVFAAASLTDAFTEIGHAFEATHLGVKVMLNFAGSQTLSAQILQGAAVDVFASANQTEMDKVVAAGLAKTDAPEVLLTNQLVVILPQNNPAGVQSLQDLARPGLKLVLADGSVPAGKYARQSLDKMTADASFGTDFADRVLANIASNETDVKQVVTKVQLCEADAGIVYVSDAIAAPQLQTIPILTDFNVTAKYPIAVLEQALQPALAAEFVAYVLSPDGQATLKKWGFGSILP